MFGSTFDYFSGPTTTGAGKVENRPQIIDLPPETYSYFLCVQFLSFSISTTKQSFSPILTTFLSPGTTTACPEKAKLITGPGWPGFKPKTYPHYFEYNSYRLSSVLLKTVLVRFWRLFRAQAPLEQVECKTGPGWLGLHPKHTHIVCGAVRTVFNQYSWKMFRPNFDDFSWPVYHISWQSWKSGSKDSILHPKHTNTLWGAILIISRQYGRKTFRSSFDNFFRFGYHCNRKSWKQASDDSV